MPPRYVRPEIELDEEGLTVSYRKSDGTEVALYCRPSAFITTIVGSPHDRAKTWDMADPYTADALREWLNDNIAEDE